MIAGWNNISSGKSSSLPASISKQKTSFDKTENLWKFITGPTCEIPGPTLLSVVRTPLNEVAKSKLSMDTSSVDTTRINT